MDSLFKYENIYVKKLLVIDLFMILDVFWWILLSQI